MIKTLRFSLFALLMMFCTAVSAQTYLWQEDFSSYSKDDVPAGGTYNYVCADNGKNLTKIYEDKLAGGTSPELLIGKSAGSFTATIPTNGVSGELTLSFMTNKTLAVSVSESDVTLGDATKSGNNFTYPVTVPASVTSITITFSNSTSSNARFDDVKLFQGDAKKNAGLSWGTASRSVTIGSADNKFPTLTNGNNLDVTYSSSDETVATINAAGEITLVAAGKTTISAAFAGNDEYEAQTVSYELTVAGETTPEDPSESIKNTPETAYTVAKAIELIEAGKGLSDSVYVAGTIVSVKEVSTTYGNATYYISDDGTSTNQLTVYRGYYLGKEKFTAEDQIAAGQKVIVYGKLVDYNGTKEMNTGNYLYSINNVTTAISSVKAENAANAPIYNLAGQRLAKMQKGLNIVGGKKVIMK